MQMGQRGSHDKTLAIDGWSSSWDTMDESSKAPRHKVRFFKYRCLPLTLLMCCRFFSAVRSSAKILVRIRSRFAVTKEFVMRLNLDRYIVFNKALTSVKDLGSFSRMLKASARNE